MPRETANFTPRFRILAEEWIEKIRSGKLPVGVLLPSERNLGLQYDLSRQTIRNAMNILEEEGWVVAHPGKGRTVQARSSTTSPTHRRKRTAQVATRQIGLICRPSLFSDNGGGSALLGLKSAFSERGYSLAMSVASEDAERRLRPVFPEWLRKDTMDGYILASVPPRVQRRMAREPKPTVSMGYLWTNADIPSVEMDFRKIRRLALHQLLERKLFPICDLFPREKRREDVKFIEEHLKGHMEAVKELKLDSSQTEIVRFPDSAFDLVAALRRVFKRETAPKSLIMSGRFLKEVLEYLDRNGIVAPRDVAILVIESSNVSNELQSRVGYFDADNFSLAQRAGEKLLAALDGRLAELRHERVVAGQFVLPPEWGNPVPV